MDSQKLFHDNMNRVMQDANNTAPTMTYNDVSDDGFNHLVFWLVNALVLMVVLSIFLWCCKFGGAECMVRWVHDITNPGTHSDMQYAVRVLERHRQRQADKMDTPEKRKAKLEKCFKRGNVVMVIEEKHFVEANDIETGVACDGADDTMDDAGGNGFIKLETKDDSIETVPNCCAVCLGDYSVGETLVKSANCPHAFHQDCVVDWFIKMQNGTPCPCCRREFTDLVQHETKKKEARNRAAQTQFNVGAISL